MKSTETGVPEPRNTAFQSRSFQNRDHKLISHYCKHKRSEALQFSALRTQDTTSPIRWFQIAPWWMVHLGPGHISIARRHQLRELTRASAEEAEEAISSSWI